MSGISKRVSGSWVSGDYGIMGTDTDTITNLPAVLYPNDTTATVGLNGNMEQTGIPSPDNPIQPQETGERTGNLFDADRWYGTYKQADGTYQTSRNTWYSLVAKPFTNDDIGKSFCFAADVVPSSGNARFAAVINGVQINGQYIGNRCEVSFTVQTIDDKIIFDYGSGSTTITTVSNVMLNTGSTAKPYEPYGYKIPISSASTTTPVYLGEVESTRNIAKYEFTGQENWTEALSGTNNHFFQLIQSQVKDVGLYEKCTHFICTQISSNNTDIGFCVTSGGEAFRVRPENTATTTLTTFKQWLADQYANGTPVTVWYVLATPTTGIVNEPIRKIGNYADEVSGITIPTIAGANTLSIGTTLQPSEVTVNYKGWHTGAVHERDSGQWN